MMELDLFGQPIVEPIESAPKLLTDWQDKAIAGTAKGDNPCIALFGEGPDGQTCQGCVHLRYSQNYHNKYYKCDLRKLTHGHATDHKVRFPACARYERRTEEYHGG